MDIKLSISAQNNVSFVLPENQTIKTIKEEVNVIKISPIPSLSFEQLINVFVNDAQDGDLITFSGGNIININPEEVLSDHVLVEDIDVTNQDAAFDHIIGTNYAVGTELEDILRDILEKYQVTTISLSSIKVAEESTSGTYGSYSNVSSTKTVEVGQGVRINGFAFSIADVSQTQDSSVSFIEGGSTVIEDGFADNLSPAQLSSYIERDLTSQSSRSYKVSAIDDGGESNVTIQSNSKTILWYYKVKWGAHPNDVPTSEAEAQILYDNIITTGGLDVLTPEATLTTTGTDATNDLANYTYLIYPSSFGAIQQILQGAVEVQTAFQDPAEFSITNDFGVSVPYYFYRSNQQQAFAPSANITIKFS